MKIHIYKDKKNEYRWRLISRGRTIADSGEGYKTRAKILKTLASIKAKTSSAPIFDMTIPTKHFGKVGSHK
jgi:uncharacterized protein YegP (UPF0339 family)